LLLLDCTYLVEPFAVMVEYVDALVAHGAVLGSLRRDGDVAQVTTTVLDHVQVLRPVQLGDRFLGRNPAQVRIRRIEEQRAEVDDDVTDVEDGVQNVECGLIQLFQNI
jgi:hypothetical protein